MPNKIYMAARYTRRHELLEYVKPLTEAGYEIVSRWIDGQEEGKTYEQIAIFDLEDVDRADIVMSFTEVRGYKHIRGGRHVEFGYGLAKGKRCVTIGSRENVFHYYPTIEVYKSLDKFIKANTLTTQDVMADAG